MLTYTVIEILLLFLLKDANLERVASSTSQDLKSKMSTHNLGIFLTSIG